MKVLSSFAVNDAGMDIELIEGKEPLFFRSGSAELPPATVKLLAVFGRELGRLPNPIAVEGHTDSVAYHSHAYYSNWELSTDRANAARRTLEANGLRRHQVDQVRGYADSKLRDPQHPTNPINRRVSILVSLVGVPSSADNPSSGSLKALKARLAIAPHISPLE